MKSLSIGQRVKALRQNLELSQEKLASKAGLTKEYISRIERDQTNNVGLETYKKVAKALDVDVSIILFGEDITSNKNNTQKSVLGEAFLPLSKNEHLLLSHFRSLPDIKAKNALIYIAQKLNGSAP